MFSLGALAAAAGPDIPRVGCRILADSSVKGAGPSAAAYPIYGGRSGHSRASLTFRPTTSVSLAIRLLWYWSCSTRAVTAAEFICWLR